MNSTTKYQEILGFGGSFTDSAGIAVDSLPEEAQAKFIEYANHCSLFTILIVILTQLLQRLFLSIRSIVVLSYC